MVTFLLILTFIGPEIAPHDPYLRQRVQYIDGQLERAPIEPGPEYLFGTDEWGRDLLSLLLYGARTTLVIAFLAITARMLLGMILGGISGWWPNGFIDNLTNGATALLAAFPGLILAMLVVYAVGIRRGQIAFVIALSAVGWGEVAQIVRGHVYSLRKELFIESARAVGLTPLQILSRHILPNLLPSLIALTSLQMASTLLLLGELGFVSVFLGAGATIAGAVAVPSQVIFETPDWGAMLGSTWRFFRVHPWLPAAPALAFLFSILSFNLFGYGLQRFADRGKFYPSGWSVARFGAVTAVVLFTFQLVLSRTGPEVAYRSKTQSFDLSRVMSEVSVLASTDLEGRVPGTDGRDLAALYIARQFEAMELTPFPNGSYYQAYQTQMGTITELPSIELINDQGDSTLIIQEGLGFDPLLPFNAQGDFEGELIIRGSAISNVLFFPGAPRRGLFLLIHTPDRVDQERTLTGSISEFVPLIITPDDEMPVSVEAAKFVGPAAFMGGDPYLMISESAAAELLSAIGYDLREIQENLGSEIDHIETGVTVRLSVGLTYETVNGLNVIGYIPGNDTRVQTQRIVVIAPYTSPAPIQGRVNPGADENVSGVSLMLELIRMWQAESFVPKRTVVFAAVDRNGAEQHLLDPILPVRPSDGWTSVELYGVGAGDVRLARLQAGPGLQELFDNSARFMNTKTQQLDNWNFYFLGGGGRGWSLPADNSYSGLAITRPGNNLSGTPLDDISNIDPELMREAGRTFAHFMMMLSSE